MTDFISVHITVPSRDSGEKIARMLVEEKLAACVNILPDVRSIFRWHGKVEAANELILLVKTRADLYADLEKRVKALHPYDVPCIVAQTITAGFPPYLDWIREETKK